MGLAVSASAKDDSPSGKAEVLGSKPVKAATKPGSKNRRWYQIGIASWYGTQFQGRKTADGERFDMHSMTCAHPTLPMGTWLRVTNLKNLKTTFVRVNDRGPVVDGRIVDLSFAAAQMLDVAGVAHVRLDAVPATDPEMAMAMMATIQMPLLPQLWAR